MPKRHFPPHSRLLQRGSSGALLSLPSPLLWHLLSFPTLQDVHIQNSLVTYSKALAAVSFLTENFKSWRFNSVSEWKKELKQKRFLQNRMHFPSLIALEMQERLSPEREQERITPMLYRCMQQRRLRLALTFSAVPKVRAQEWDGGSAIKRPPIPTTWIRSPGNKNFGN